TAAAVDAGGTHGLAHAWLHRHRVTAKPWRLLTAGLYAVLRVVDFDRGGTANRRPGSWRSLHPLSDLLACDVADDVRHRQLRLLPTAVCRPNQCLRTDYVWRHGGRACAGLRQHLADGLFRARGTDFHCSFASYHAGTAGGGNPPRVLRLDLPSYGDGRDRPSRQACRGR